MGGVHAAASESSAPLLGDGGLPRPPPARHALTSECIRSRSVLLRTRHGAAWGASTSACTRVAILNLVVATAGGIGMVTLPGSFAQVGWLEAVLLLVFSTCAAAASLWLLDWACAALDGRSDEVEEEATASYAALVAHTLGPWGSTTLEALTLTYCVGQVVSYLGAIGAQTTSLLSLAGLHHLANAQVLPAAAALMGTMALLPEAGAMRFAGALGTACMLYIVLAVVFGDGVRAIERGGICSLAAASADDGAMAFSPSLPTMLRNAPIFLFAMNASVTFVPIRHQQRKGLADCMLPPSSATAAMKEKKKGEESRKVIALALLASAGFYLACAGVAYWAYCAQVPENVVDAWPLTWVPGVMARGFLALELLAAGAGIYVPLGRASAWHLVRGVGERVAAGGVARAAVTAAIVAAGCGGSLALGGALALPLAVTSALCVSAQMFVLPGLSAAALLRAGRRRGKGKKGRVAAAVAFACFGAALGLLSLAALFGLIQGD
mmetsp:Transcript_13410/g.28338  ORF Transcript_13410/g.28338 Transcript_13410/m.28338 type:complete len:495 (+) Transcript_13410:61-1545(+)